MRKLVITENVTLDGYLEPMQGWFDPGDSDEELLAVNAEHRQAADALLLGRITYQEFAGFWPAQVDDQTGISDYLNQVDKYVVSTTLKRAEWINSTILNGSIEDEIAALKRKPGKDIVLTGSVRLVRSLAPSGLVDVYRLFVYPLVQGHGRRLFADEMAAELQLLEARSFSSGVVFMAYGNRGAAG